MHFSCSAHRRESKSSVDGALEIFYFSRGSEMSSIVLCISTFALIDSKFNRRD